MVTSNNNVLKDNLDDIQGIVIRGYGRLRSACFQLLGITDASAAKKWLGSIIDEIQDGRTAPGESCINIAFTYRGLEKLGLKQQWLTQFSREFQEGIITAHRQRILADTGDSDPAHWEWGGPNNAPIDLLLMFYGKDDDELNTLYQKHSSQFDAHGLIAFDNSKLETTQLRADGKEHFGFRDGISQPRFAGYKGNQPEWNSIAAGEFLLGYPNEYELYTERPLIEPSEDSDAILANDLEDSGKRDLGRNGSYLVFRQIAQHVQKFWQFMDDNTNPDGQTSDPHSRQKLAAKMIGRWPDGSPLILAPENPDESLKMANDFKYHKEDPDGLICPLGSHVRRTNPRDMLDPRPGTKDSIEINKRHRILRRGRPYGTPMTATLDPDEILKSIDNSENRGLHFICLNANISRQFEFIQHTWSNNQKFSGLYDDADPIVGYHGLDAGQHGTFTVPADPVRDRYTNLPNFVTLRGGGYFFLPGIRAIKFIASVVP